MEDNPDVIEVVLTESTDFEINNKVRLNTMIKFVAAKSKKVISENKMGSRYHKLQNLEVNLQCGHSLSIHIPSVIDNYKSLSKVEKFNYLRSFLYGKALRSMSSFTLRNESYDKTMKLLKRRFKDNHKMHLTWMSY